MREGAMNPSQDFNRLYKDVSDSIAAAMKDISGIEVDHKGGKKELSNMMDRLRNVQARFDGELDLLEKHAEWDKFTIAFFGETNAGKSTLIESLRILFNEDSRQQLLMQNAQNLLKFEQAYSGHVNQVRDGLKEIYLEYASEIESIKQSASLLVGVLQEESSARIKRKLWMVAIGGIFFGGGVVGVIYMLAGV